MHAEIQSVVGLGFWPEKNDVIRKPGEEKACRTAFSHQYYRQAVEGYTAASHAALHAGFGAAVI